MFYLQLRLYNRVLVKMEYTTTPSHIAPVSHICKVWGSSIFGIMYIETALLVVILILDHYKRIERGVRTRVKHEEWSARLHFTLTVFPISLSDFSPHYHRVTLAPPMSASVKYLYYFRKIICESCQFLVDQCNSGVPVEMSEKVKWRK